jgi:hypothetical protein
MVYALGHGQGRFESTNAPKLPFAKRRRWPGDMRAPSNKRTSSSDRKKWRVTGSLLAHARHPGPDLCTTAELVSASITNTTSIFDIHIVIDIHNGEIRRG